MLRIWLSPIFSLRDYSGSYIAPLTVEMGNHGGDYMQENIISAEIEPLPNQANRAALALQRLGFRILNIGPTISVQGPQSLWVSTFNVSFKLKKKTAVAEEEEGEVTYKKAWVEGMRVPTELQNLIAEVMFVEPPEFY